MAPATTTPYIRNRSGFEEPRLHSSHTHPLTKPTGAGTRYNSWQEIGLLTWHAAHADPVCHASCARQGRGQGHGRGTRAGAGAVARYVMYDVWYNYDVTMTMTADGRTDILYESESQASVACRTRYYNRNQEDTCLRGTSQSN